MYLSPEERARRGTASDFAKWVFEKFHPPSRRSASTERLQEERMELGSATHDDIERMRLWAKHNTKLGKDDWELVFADLHDRNTDSAYPIYRSSWLTWDGKPVRCRPDVVLRNKNSGEVLIVERKVTTSKHRSRATDHAWARIRAQLWCYAWIDEWKDASEVYLVCEWWADHKKSDVTPCFLRSDPRLNRECQNLWNEYGGKWLGPSLDTRKIRQRTSVGEFSNWLEEQVANQTMRRGILSAVSSEWLVALCHLNDQDRIVVAQKLKRVIKAPRLATELTELISKINLPCLPEQQLPNAPRCPRCPRCNSRLLVAGPCGNCGL